MNLASRIITLMSGLTSFQVRAMPPLERMRLAQECRRLLLAADPLLVPPRTPTEVAPKQPCSGILADLRDGDRAP